MAGLPNKNVLLNNETLNNSVSGYGLSETIGGRITMEDASVAVPEYCSSGFWGEHASLFMICDGHGIANGERASQFVRDTLPSILKAKISEGSDPTQIFTEVFIEVDSLMQQHPEMDDTGTTVALAYVEGNRLVVANVGDSEIVMDRNGDAEILTVPHKAYLEADRITAAGGEMRQGRVKGTSGKWNAVGRSLGEKTIGKPYVIAKPDVKIVDLNTGDSRIIIACDGLWDEINHDEAVNLVREVKEPQQAVDMLVKEAAEVRYSRDNVSAIVVNLNSKNVTT